MPVELGLPRLKDRLLSLDDAPLPSFVGSQIGIAVFFVVLIMIALSGLLRTLHLPLDVLIASGSA